MSTSVLDSHFIAHPSDFLPHEDEKRPFRISFVSAVILHMMFLFFGGMVLVKSPEYGIDLGAGGMEVYLVAAPVETSKGQPQSKQPLQDRHQEIEKNPEAEMAIPILDKKANDPKNIIAQKKSALAAKNSKNRGDGSSSVPGADPTTFYSPGGAWIESKVGHLRNPAPYYPQTAIELGQEGLVVLSVLVSREGHPDKVEIKESSGFPLLDKSALSTIKKWKFSPGRTGFHARDVWVTIPIRFKLEDAMNS